MNTNGGRLIWVMCLVTLMAGCGGNEQVARVAIQAADRQAQQNNELARLNREVAEGTKKLVEADAKARTELIAAQKDLQSQQAEIGKHRDQLETERQTIAQQRQTVSLWTPLLQGLGMVLVAALAIALCYFLLYGLRRDPDGTAELGELLVVELAAEKPRLLPVQHCPKSVLPAPDHSNSEVTDDR